MKNSLPIIFIILAIGLFYVYVGPQYSNIKTLLGERDNYDGILEKSVELRDLREALRDKMEVFSSTDLERLEKMIPQDVDPVRLILDLDNLARRYGIVMLDMNTELIGGEDEKKSGETPNSSKPYQILSLDFNFSSSYSNFISFMSDIESSLRIMDVASVTVSVDEEEPRTPKFEVVINSYWLR